MGPMVQSAGISGLGRGLWVGWRGGAPLIATNFRPPVHAVQGYVYVYVHVYV